MSRPRRSSHQAVVFALVTALLVTGCGLSAEKRPHEITDHAITRLLSPPSTTAPSGDVNAPLYFVRGERLERVSVPAGTGQATSDQVLRLLLSGRPRNASKGLTTSIPAPTTLRGTSLQGSTLRIDLQGQIKSLGGSGAEAAYAQIVFTALALPGVDSVRFAIEGSNIDAITDDGSRSIIRADNYKGPLNPYH